MRRGLCRVCTWWMSLNWMNYKVIFFFLGLTYWKEFVEAHFENHQTTVHLHHIHYYNATHSKCHSPSLDCWLCASVAKKYSSAWPAPTLHPSFCLSFTSREPFIQSTWINSKLRSVKQRDWSCAPTAGLLKSKLILRSGCETNIFFSLILDMHELHAEMTAHHTTDEVTEPEGATQHLKWSLSRGSRPKHKHWEEN